MRKVRHPYQVLETSEMVVGQLYAFIYAHEDGNCFASRYTMGGVFDDTRATARRLGYDLDSEDSLRIEMLIASVVAGPIVTVHTDGWHDGEEEQDPTLMYWRDCLGGVSGWDRIRCYMGPEEKEGDERHFIVVPDRHWADDPRLHVANWSNPDGVVERALIVVESAAGWERRMRARAHAAMAKSLGF